MWYFGNLIVSGLINSCIYALIAVGFSLIFSVSGILAFTQGAYMVVGVLLMYTLHKHGIPTGATFVIALAVVTVVSLLLDRIVIRGALGRISHTNLLMMMAGLLIAFQGVGYVFWGTQTYSLQSYLSPQPYKLGQLLIPTQAIFVAGSTILVSLLVWLFLGRTWIGRGMRSASQDSIGARLCGIPVTTLVAVAFVLAAILAVIAGASFAPLASFDSVDSMLDFTLYGLIAATLGGIGSVRGAVLGSFVLGIGQSLFEGYASSTYSTVFIAGLLIVLLVLRPSGLLRSSGLGTRADTAEQAFGRVFLRRTVRPITARLSTLVVVAVMASLPWVLAHGGWMQTVNTAGIMCLAVLGLDLLTGMAGQVSLGQGAFMSIGGYGSALLMVHAGVSSLVALALSLLIALAVAALVGVVCSRLRGMYLATATLAIGILAEALVTSLNVTGGANGMSVPKPFAIGGFAFNTPTRFFFLIWGIAGIAAVALLRFRRSIEGQALRVMHADDVGARALGVRALTAKVTVFMIGAGLASIAGSLYADNLAYISPNQIGMSTSLLLVTMMVLGGYGTVIGPILGAVGLTLLPVLVQSLAKWSMLIDGGVLVLVLRFSPGGLFGLFLDGLGRVPVLDRLVYQPTLRAQTKKPEVLHRPTPAQEGADAEAPVLLVDGLSKRFGGLQALNDVDLSVGAGRIVGIIGANGAGKSTLLNVLTGVDQPDHGVVSFYGKDITGWAPERISQLGLARTFQRSRFFPQLTVLENVMVGAYARDRRYGRLAHFVDAGPIRREDLGIQACAVELLELVGLADRANDSPNALSLAQQKLLDISRVVMAKPRFVMLDEPGAGLHHAESVALGELLVAIRRAGTSVMVIDHNLSLIMGIADEVVMLDVGSVLTRGTPGDVESAPEVVEAYMGIPASA